MYLLSIDAGGSFTRAVLLDKTGEVIDIGLAGPANPAGVGWDTALKNIGLAIKKILEKAYSSDIDLCVLSVAYTGWGRHKEKYVEYLRYLLGKVRIAIIEDHKAALISCFPRGEGIVYIMGTGSSCYGRLKDREVLLGSWGYLFGDIGSAYSIGKKGIIAALNYYDGLSSYTKLYDYLINEWGRGRSLFDIIDNIYNSSSPKATVASFAPYVIKAYEEGDESARSILEESILLSLKIISTAMKRLDYDKNEIGLTGGFYERASRVIDELIAKYSPKIVGKNVYVRRKKCPIECALATYGILTVLNTALSDDDIEDFISNCSRRLHETKNATRGVREEISNL